MPTWPSTLPISPVSGSLRITIDPNLAAYQNEVGDDIRRRRYTASRKVYSGTIELAGDQIETLRAFFEDECSDGVLAFTMADWWGLTQGLSTTAEFKFVQPPEFNHRDVDLYQVSLVLSKTS